MKILICDTLNSKVLEELKSLGECIDISASESKDQDLVLEIIDAEILFKTPMINKIPGITSANAMIMASSPGIPIDEIHPTNPSLLNLLYP